MFRSGQDRSVSISESDMCRKFGRSQLDPTYSRAYLVVTGHMEIPLQPGNTLCFAYNGLFIYIFWPQALGSSGLEAYTHLSCGLLRLVLMWWCFAYRWADKGLTGEVCFASKQATLDLKMCVKCFGNLKHASNVHMNVCFKQVRSRCTGLYSPLTQGRWVSFLIVPFCLDVLIVLAWQERAHHVYFPLLQPDELYFEEGDILYISDTVCLWSLLVLLGSTNTSSCDCVDIHDLHDFLVIAGFVFRVTVTGGKGHAGEGLDLFPVITVRKASVRFSY